MDLIGSRIGNVSIRALLGEGGMGKVYRGFDEVLERPVAIKILQGEERLSSLGKARLLREARVLSKLDHPNICRIYDIEKDSDCDYLILELIEGRTLRRVISTGAFGKDQLLELAEKVALALAAAHEENIVHRDLKPENIMMTDEGEVKVLDFGLSRTVEDKSEGMATPGMAVPETANPEKTTEGSILGTLLYMSPEQARGETLTEASDMYSFGILLQELITGRKAYPEDAGPLSLYKMVCEGKTLPVTEVDDTDLAQLISLLKHIDPQKRPNATETAQKLRFLREKPARRRSSRQRFFLGLLVLALLAMTAAAAFHFAKPKQLLAPGQEGRIAFLPFANETGNPSDDWISIGFMDMIAGAVDANPQLTVIPTESIVRSVKYGSVQGKPELTAPEVKELCGIVGSQFVVTARVTRSNDTYHVLAHLYDVQGFQSSYEISNMRLSAIAEELSSILNDRLAPNHLVPAIADQYSDSDIANQDYAIGIQRMMTTGPAVAEKYFAVCVDLDPKFSRAKMKLAVCLIRQRKFSDGEPLLKQVLQDSRLQKDAKLEAQCLREIGVFHKHNSDNAQAKQFWNQALPLAVTVGDLDNEAKILNNLALVAQEGNDLEEAETLYQEALKIKRRIGDRAGEAVSLNNLAVLAYIRGEIDLEEKLLEQSLAISREIGDLDSLAFSLGNMGALYMDKNDPGKSETTLREAIEITRKLRDTEGEAANAYNLAEVLLLQDRTSEAQEWIRIAKAWYVDDPILIVLDADLAYSENKPVEARDLMRKAKSAIGKDWGKRNEALLLTFEKAAQLRRKLPLQAAQ